MRSAEFKITSLFDIRFPRHAPDFILKKPPLTLIKHFLSYALAVSAIVARCCRPQPPGPPRFHFFLLSKRDSHFIDIKTNQAREEVNGRLGW